MRSTIVDRRDQYHYSCGAGYLVLIGETYYDSVALGDVGQSVVMGLLETLDKLDLL